MLKMGSSLLGFISKEKLTKKEGVCRFPLQAFASCKLKFVVTSKEPFSREQLPLPEEGLAMEYLPLVVQICPP